MAQITFKEGMLAMLFSMMMVILLSGCTSNQNSNNSTTLVSDPNTVILQNFAFTPNLLAVTNGTTVTWINKDSVSHTVTSDTGLFNSTLAPGAKFTYKFDNAGKYAYHCDIHLAMKGEIMVIGAGQNNTAAETVQNSLNTAPLANGTNAAQSGESSHKAYTIVMQDNAFTPQNLDIIGSGTVTWINNDPSYHKIVGDHGKFSSSILATGENYTYEFNASGNYTYHCSIHSSMTGEIRVSGQNNSNELGSANTASTGYEQTVEIEASRFNPQNVAIYEGDDVKWINHDNTTHKIESDSFSSNDIEINHTYARKFTATGTYEYKDAYANITGVVVVSRNNASNQTSINANTNETITNATTNVTNTNATVPVNETASTQAATNRATIEIKNKAFTPQMVTVLVGGIVEWVNGENVAHKIQSDGFHSPNMSIGDSYAHEFDSVGTYKYYDALNNGVTGQVIVVNSSSAANIATTSTSSSETKTVINTTKVNVSDNQTQVNISSNTTLANTNSTTTTNQTETNTSINQTQANTSIQTNTTTIFEARTVQIKSSSYSPDIINLNKGETVTWKNIDSASHRILAHTFASGEIPAGGSYSMAFNSTGSYAYWDLTNSGMMGQIIVN